MVACPYKKPQIYPKCYSTYSLKRGLCLGTKDWCCSSLQTYHEILKLLKVCLDLGEMAYLPAYYCLKTQNIFFHLKLNASKLVIVDHLYC